MSAIPRADELLAIAHCVRPHGLHGELQAIPLTPPIFNGADLIVDRRLFARDAQGRVQVVHGKSVRGHQDRWLIQLAEAGSMDEAELFRGRDLCLPREELPVLPEGWFWEEDLQQCEVVDRRLGFIGHVEGLDLNGAQPQLLIRRPAGATAMIPWRRVYIVDVNLQTRQIQTDLPDEFPGISASANSDK